MSAPFPDRLADLERRYRLAADEVATRLAGVPAGSVEPSLLDARMRAVVDAVWTFLSDAGVSWVGFYLPAATDSAPEGIELVLGPSRNKPACSPIGLHGVCGQSFRGSVTRIVHDVRDLGADYVACDPRDRSEIVLPVGFGATRACQAVLDLDSHDVGRFGPADAAGLRLVLESAGFSVVG